MRECVLACLFALVRCLHVCDVDAIRYNAMCTMIYGGILRAHSHDIYTVYIRTHAHNECVHMDVCVCVCVCARCSTRFYLTVFLCASERGASVRQRVCVCKFADWIDTTQTTHCDRPGASALTKRHSVALTTGSICIRCGREYKFKN